MDFQCPVCHSKEYIFQISCKDYTVSKEKFDIVSCKNCGLWQTFPYPEEDSIGKYYQSEEYISHSDKRETFFDKIYHLVRKYTLAQKVNLIKKYVPHGTILDIGCGTGYFLQECKKSGFDVFGIEPSEKAREICLKKSLNVCSKISDVDNTKKYDVITLWHVLEHLYHPDNFIRKFHVLLKDKGYLILALPNRLSYDAKKYEEYWAGYDVPRHLFHFTKKDVVNLTKDKFKMVCIQPMFFDAFYVSMLSEKYKGNKRAFLKGLVSGCVSNIKAMKKNNYSSLIYVLQKI